MRYALLILTAISFTGCGLDDDDGGWGRARSGEFRNCKCEYAVQGIVEQSEAGRMDIFAVVNGGRRADYNGGKGSLLFDCATRADGTSDKGVAIVLDDFNGPGSYDLAAPAFLDPSSMEFVPTNLGRASYRPVEGGQCYIDIHEERSGDFGCLGMRGPEDTQVDLSGTFTCER